MRSEQPVTAIVIPFDDLAGDRRRPYVAYRRRNRRDFGMLDPSVWTEWNRFPHREMTLGQIAARFTRSGGSGSGSGSQANISLGIAQVREGKRDYIPGRPQMLLRAGSS